MVRARLPARTPRGRVLRIRLFPTICVDNLFLYVASSTILSLVCWYDPPFASGFEYELSSGNFTEVGTPPASFGFGRVELFIEGMDQGSLNPGGTFDFIAHGLDDVTKFSLVGINPLLDTASPDFASAFPTFLGFDGSPEVLTMTAILEPDTVPEPSSLAILLGSILAVLPVPLLRRRNRLTA